MTEQDEYVEINIMPDLTKWQAAFQALRETFQRTVKYITDAWSIIPDEMREAAAEDAGLRYWTDRQGRTRRNRTMKPILHNGRKP